MHFSGNAEFEWFQRHSVLSRQSHTWQSAILKEKVDVSKKISYFRFFNGSQLQAVHSFCFLPLVLYQTFFIALACDIGSSIKEKQLHLYYEQIVSI